MNSNSSSNIHQFPPDLEKNPESPPHHQEISNLHRIHTSHGGEVVHMGPYSFKREELITAFGGTLNPGLAAPPPIRGLNSVPAGLSSFAFCAFVLSLFHLQARDATNPSIIVGSCFFYGGVIEMICGLMALIIDNTFAGTALTCFGGFWLSFGAILCDAFHISSSYATKQEFNNALGFFLMGWFCFAFVIWLCTWKSTWPFFTLFLLIWVWILVLACAQFYASVAATKAGGVLGLLSSFLALYLVYAGLATPENSFLVPQPLYMPGAEH